MPDRKTVTVQRANVILEVPEDWADNYVNQGYNIIDEKGNIIKASLPRTVGELQRAYLEHIREIEELKQTIEQLKQKKTTRSKK